jgi:hypothetical protein
MADATQPSLHPDLAVLRPLVGTWSGTGHGQYPTIEAFDYTETVTFEPTGKPFLSYRQATQRASDGSPLHSEVGYLRLVGSQAELVLVQPTGVVEVDEGPVVADGDTLSLVLQSQTVATTSTAKEVAAVERTLSVTGDVLHVTLSMAAVGVAMTAHLDATLRRR